MVYVNISFLCINYFTRQIKDSIVQRRITGPSVEKIIENLLAEEVDL